MKRIEKIAPGPCPACGDRLAPAATTGREYRGGDHHSPALPHFRCTGCRIVFAMSANFDLRECECPSEHVLTIAPRNLEADAAEVRNRYFPLSRSPRSKVPA